MCTCYRVVGGCDGTDDSPVKFGVYAGEGKVSIDVGAASELLPGAE
jgi:hypothetical protein